MNPKTNNLTLVCRLIILEQRRDNVERIFNDNMCYIRRKRINKVLWYINRKISIIEKLIKK